LGALFIQFVPVWAGDIDVALAGLVYGVSLMLTLVLIPDGLGGLVKRIATWLRARIGWQPQSPQEVENSAQKAKATS
ncbi:MAG: hypothetical protein AB7O79_08355, partial [Xanthobacteraceae bacterium]